jgi:polysaccharide pyruvyl transferase WcaK-like protein
MQCLPQTCDWASVVDLYARATVSLNSRLHSGVLATSSLTPAVYIASNVKYHDFMATLGLQSYILDANA